MTHRLWYCDHYAIPLPEGHRFPMAKYRMVRDLLAADSAFRFDCATPAAPAVVSLAHDAAYVDAVVAGTLDSAAIRRIGFPWSPGLVLRSLASVGGTLGASADALERGWGANLAGGTHHAFRGEGAGFCVFNDIAVAIESLRAQGSIRRAAVIDVDVHQGDGTAQIFERDPTVFTLSLHGEKNFPFRKQRSTVDIALPDGTGDEEYLRQLTQALPQALDSNPDMVFFQAGVDTLESDTLGRLALTPAGLAERDRLVLTACRAAGVPVTVTMGGGYSKPIELTAQAHAATYRAAAGILTRATSPAR